CYCGGKPLDDVNFQCFDLDPTDFVVDDDLLAQAKNLGFSEADARAALEMTRNDLEAALPNICFPKRTSFRMQWSSDFCVFHLIVMLYAIIITLYLRGGFVTNSKP
ncbi:UBA/TS-N domain protein, partial [Ostertagia ostertagi]